MSLESVKGCIQYRLFHLKYTFCIQDKQKLHVFSGNTSPSYGGRMRTVHHFTVLFVLILRVALRRRTSKAPMCALALTPRYPSSSDV